MTPRLLVIPGCPGPGPARAAVGRAAAAGGLGDAAGGAGLARRPPRDGPLVRHRQHGDCASAIATAAKTGGRPLRGKSRRPSMPAWQKRRRHFRAVSTVIPSSRAMAAFEWPALAARTIRARRLSRTVVFTRAARRVRVRPNNCGFAQGGVGLTGAARGEMSTGRRNGRAHEDERGHHRGVSGCRGRGPGVARRVSPQPRWREHAASGSLGRLCARRIPGLRTQHMHNPPVAEILQPFSPKEVG
ncbi:MAG: hypothetical protein JWQ59_726 [Cryobacterium sp.]|nr:hypothetical protein [Cryobacterium sp.]